MMPTFAKAASTFMIPALLALGIFGSSEASAQTAPAAPPCTGTLCDLYYGGSGSAATPSTSASPSATQQGVPLAVPTGNLFSGLFNGSRGTQAAPGAAAPNAQPASTPFVRVVGGRPANERCTGTVCDLFYNGSDAPAPAKPVGQQQASATAVVPAAEPGIAPSPVRKHVAAPQPKPICHNDRDPWQCYR